MPDRNAVTWCALLMILPLASLNAQQSGAPAPAPQSVQGTTLKLDRERALGILDSVVKGIREYYYDPNLLGPNWDAAIATARTKIGESNTINQALAQVAVAVSSLNDSHTTFRPPFRPIQLDFGLQYEMIWSRCFIIRVRPGSDSAAQGLKPGGEILTIDGIRPERQNLWSIEYLTYILDPRPQMELEVQYATGDKQKVQVNAKVTPVSGLAYRPGAGVLYDLMRKDENLEHQMRMQWVSFGNDVCIMKFPWFFYSQDAFYVVGAKIGKAKSLIVDLRGNSGGSNRYAEVFRRNVFRS